MTFSLKHWWSDYDDVGQTARAVALHLSKNSLPSIPGIRMSESTTGEGAQVRDHGQRRCAAHRRGNLKLFAEQALIPRE